MVKTSETGLIIRKETKFDKIINKLMMFFFNREEYLMIERYQKLLTPKPMNNKKIIIPKEIGKGKKNAMF